VCFLCSGYRARRAVSLRKKGTRSPAAAIRLNLTEGRIAMIWLPDQERTGYRYSLAGLFLTLSKRYGD
jgi:hypothetical protein